MARAAIILAVLAAVGVVRVQLGREEDRMRHEVHRELTRQVEIRRRLWAQRVQIGKMLAPREVKLRIEQMVLDLTGENESRSRVADSGDRPAGEREE